MMPFLLIAVPILSMIFMYQTYRIIILVVHPSVETQNKLENKIFYNSILFGVLVLTCLFCIAAEPIFQSSSPSGSPF
ncbi:hypothetical protein LCM20_09345 [Halobacillus litoralis]|uniref:hypothetical protein n=1 Tax=Halobacillus litoralis TaxID=45668 RepID=UPI001CD7DBA7|nr:hypothetical protein [Halobacillus litoralis]MCA0970793.1 hypothetical protein [Halobacillus litoralis]